MTGNVYDAIQSFIGAGAVSQSQAKSMLSAYSDKVQGQLICAMYVGRDHLHSTELQQPGLTYAGYTDHISSDEYALIIYEKNSNVGTYLSKMLECSGNSGFDLNNL
ncbi:MULTISPECIES: hypothetical protein [unclassified Pseudomonas]|uniref:hypothetical protein n=1 Tax=unclassified Pseudomonas TaxID=196821 RepID=UPI0025E73A60|nr:MULTISPECIES: hypothetical protein [unclassified Pseudomonas]